MGIIRMGPPEKLIQGLAAKFQITNFVETGTYYAKTAIWASKNFEKVTTIEYSHEIYENVKSKYGDVKNIEFLFGDSRTKLKESINELKGSAIFWLDAHWSGGLTYGDNEQCPLIDEINIINNSSIDQFIIIDDARLFLSTPQPPHKMEQWPTISEVIDALKSKFTDKYIVIIEDVIVAVPSYSKPLVAAYCQEVNAKFWQNYGKEKSESDLEKGFDLIATHTASKIKSFSRKIKSRIQK